MVKNDKENPNFDWSEFDTLNIKKLVAERLDSEQHRSIVERIIQASAAVRTIADLEHRSKLTEYLKLIKKNKVAFEDPSVLQQFVLEIVTQPGLVPKLVFVWLALLTADLSASTNKPSHQFLEVVIREGAALDYQLAFICYGVYIARFSQRTGKSSDQLLRMILGEYFSNDYNNPRLAETVLRIQTAISYWKTEVSTTDWEQVKVPVTIVTQSDSDFEQPQHSRVTDEPRSRILLSEGRLPGSGKMKLGLGKGVPVKSGTYYEPRVLPVSIGVGGTTLPTNEISSRVFYAHYELPSISPTRLEDITLDTANVYNLSTEQVLDWVQNASTPPNSLGSLTYWVAVRLRDDIETRWNHLANYESKAEKPNFENIETPEQLEFIRKRNDKKIQAVSKAIIKAVEEISAVYREQEVVYQGQKVPLRISLLGQAFIDAYGLTAYLDSMVANEMTKQWSAIRHQLLSNMIKDVLSLTVLWSQEKKYYDLSTNAWSESSTPIDNYFLTNRTDVITKVKKNWLSDLSDDDKISLAFIHASSNSMFEAGELDVIPDSLSDKITDFRSTVLENITTGGFSVPELEPEEYDWLLLYYIKNEGQVKIRWQTIRNRSEVKDPSMDFEND